MQAFFGVLTRLKKSDIAQTYTLDNNDKKARYRWLLLVSEVRKRFLSKGEQVHIRHQLAPSSLMANHTNGL